MEPQEAQALYDHIAAFLRQGAGVDGRPESDLLAEVEAEIDAGRPVAVRLRVSSEEQIADPVAGGRAASTRGSAEFIERRPFSSHEKLEILVESLALAAAGPPLMAEQILRIISEKAAGHEDKSDIRPEIFLARDENPEPERVVQPEELPEQAAAARSLLKFLDEVRTDLRPGKHLRKDESD